MPHRKAARQSLVNRRSLIHHPLAARTATQKPQQGLVDLLRTFLLDIVASTFDQQRPLQVRHSGRHRCQRCFASGSRYYQVLCASDKQGPLTDHGASPRSKQFPIAIYVAVPVQSASSGSPANSALRR